MIDIIEKDLALLYQSRFNIDVDVLMASHDDYTKKRVYTHHKGINPWPGSTTLTDDDHIEWEIKVKFKDHCNIGSFFNSGSILTFMPEFNNDRDNAQSLFWNTFFFEQLIFD